MRFHFFCKKSFYIFLTLFFILFSCSDDDDFVKVTSESPLAKQYDAEVVTSWFSLIKTLTKETDGYSPPVAARAFGYTGVALYQGVVLGMQNKKSLSGKLIDLEMSIALDNNKTYHWPTVANGILFRMTNYFYSNTSADRLEAINAMNNEFSDQFLLENGVGIFEVSDALAAEVSAEIIAWSKTDGGVDAQFNNYPTDYMVPASASWKPTAPNFSPALQPYWGNNRPFLMANITDVQPTAPPLFSADINSLCYQRAMEVYTTVNNLTDEQKIIAEFWSDDPKTTATPPGHSIAILNQLIQENNLTLDVAAEAYMKLGIGISDAFVSCWKTKYETVYVRPITFITENIDPNWTSYLITPPFPEYTSGHSVQSGTLAEIMTNLFGDNYNFTDKTHQFRTDIDGTPRNYNSFYEMAEEAAISRLYGGIHFKEGIDLGLIQGYEIGKIINALDIDK